MSGLIDIGGDLIEGRGFYSDLKTAGYPFQPASDVRMNC
jgi:hypothetical protein